jgi:hypothetical protein
MPRIDHRIAPAGDLPVAAARVAAPRTDNLHPGSVGRRYAIPVPPASAVGNNTGRLTIGQIADHDILQIKRIATVPEQGGSLSYGR